MRRSLYRMGQFVLDLFGQPTDQPPVASTRAERSPACPQDAWGTRGAVRHQSLASILLVFSRRMKRSWRLERPRTHPVLHLPEALRNAPPEIWEALGDWVVAQLRPSPGSRVRGKIAARIVFDWMGDTTDRLPQGSSKGRHHDLQTIFDHVNRTCFDGRIQAVVRWSPRPGSLSTHRVVHAPDGDIHLITIGLVYDHPSVPRFALEGVVRHEMLHIVHPPRRNALLKRHVHHKGFRSAEAAFPDYQAWKAWEIQEMPRLIRLMRRQRKR